LIGRTAKFRVLGNAIDNPNKWKSHMPHTPATFQLEIATELVARFRREAVVRDMPVRALMLELLDVIERDKLIDAILDYEPPAPKDKKLGRPKKDSPHTAPAVAVNGSR
jgi:hypothetical protein